MDRLAEVSFVNDYVLRSRRERLLYELSTPAKRRDALSRFCHQAPQLLDPARIRMQGEDLDRSAPFLSFVRDHDGFVARCRSDSRKWFCRGVRRSLQGRAGEVPACLVRDKDSGIKRATFLWPVSLGVGCQLLYFL